MEAFNQSDPNSCVQLPDIHPKSFAIEKLPDGIILPPAAIGRSLNMSRPSAMTKVPLAKHTHNLRIPAMRYVRRNGLT
jgi:hypothetical protein